MTLFGDGGEKSELGRTAWPQGSGEETAMPASTVWAPALWPTAEGSTRSQRKQSQVQKYSALESRMVEVFCPHLAGRRGKKSSLTKAAEHSTLDAAGGTEKPEIRDAELLPLLHPTWLIYATTYFPALKNKAWSFKVP